MDESQLSVPKEEVPELTESMLGRWLVCTQGSEHVWDLDAMTYQRLPGRDRGHFEFDGQVLRISRITRWPKVGGQSVVWFDDPTDALIEQWRISSRIRLIVRMRT